MSARAVAARSRFRRRCEAHESSEAISPLSTSSTPAEGQRRRVSRSNGWRATPRRCRSKTRASTAYCRPSATCSLLAMRLRPRSWPASAAPGASSPRPPGRRRDHRVLLQDCRQLHAPTSRHRRAADPLGLRAARARDAGATRSRARVRSRDGHIPEARRRSACHLLRGEVRPRRDGESGLRRRGRSCAATSSRCSSPRTTPATGRCASRPSTSSRSGASASRRRRAGRRFPARENPKSPSSGGGLCSGTATKGRVKF